MVPFSIKLSTVKLSNLTLTRIENAKKALLNEFRFLIFCWIFFTNFYNSDRIELVLRASFTFTFVIYSGEKASSIQSNLTIKNLKKSQKS